MKLHWPPGFYVCLDGKPLRGPFYHREAAVKTLEEISFGLNSSIHDEMVKKLDIRKIDKPRRKT